MTAECPEHAQTGELRRIYDALTQADELHRRGGTDLESALRSINQTSVTSIHGAEYAGVTVLAKNGALTTLGATDDVVNRLDDIQRDTRQGPCLSAAWTHHTILLDDLTTDDRWPAFQRAALDRSQVRSVLSFRLHEEGSSVAALNFYADTPGVFDDESIELGLIFAAHTTLAWNAMRREQQFQSALTSRDVIGQAKGMLMERFNIEAVAAFELLRTLSQQANSKISEIAQRVVAIGPDDGLR